MKTLLLGLVLFLGMHSVRIGAEDWRQRAIARWGHDRWKGFYSAVSLLGFGMIVWGYGQARQAPALLWSSPPWTRHLTALMMLAAMVMLIAACVPGNAIRARVGHPMVLSVQIWAMAHLLANNTLADLLLFGSFALWAGLDFRAARRRDAAAGSVRSATRPGAALVTVGLGAAVWSVLVFGGHAALFGVQPIAR